MIFVVSTAILLPMTDLYFPSRVCVFYYIADVRGMINQNWFVGLVSVVCHVLVEGCARCIVVMSMSFPRPCCIVIYYSGIVSIYFHASMVTGTLCSTGFSSMGCTILCASLTKINLGANVSNRTKIDLQKQPFTAYSSINPT